MRTVTLERLLSTAVMIMGMWSLPWGSHRVYHDRLQYKLGEQKDISIAESVELSRPMCVGLPSLSMQRPSELIVL